MKYHNNHFDIPVDYYNWDWCLCEGSNSLSHCYKFPTRNGLWLWFPGGHSNVRCWHITALDIFIKIDDWHELQECWRFLEPPTAATRAIAAHLSWEHHFRNAAHRWLNRVKLCRTLSWTKDVFPSTETLQIKVDRIKFGSIIKTYCKFYLLSSWHLPLWQAMFPILNLFLLLSFFMKVAILETSMSLILKNQEVALAVLQKIMAAITILKSAISQHPNSFPALPFLELCSWCFILFAHLRLRLLIHRVAAVLYIAAPEATKTSSWAGWFFQHDYHSFLTIYIQHIYNTSSNMNNIKHWKQFLYQTSPNKNWPSLPCAAWINHNLEPPCNTAVVGRLTWHTLSLASNSPPLREIVRESWHRYTTNIHKSSKILLGSPST